MKRLQGLRLPFGLAFAVAAGAVLSAGAAYAQSKTLNVLSNGGSVDKAIQEALGDFEKKHDVTIRWIPGSSGDNAAKVVATKDRPEYDIVMGEDISYQGLSDRGLLAKLDRSIVTNYDSMRPEGQFKAQDGIIVGFNFNGLFYSTEEFKKNNWAPPTSWEDMYRPEFCKRVGLLSPTVSYTLNFVMMAAGGDVNKVPEAISKKISKLKGCIPTLEPSAPKLEEKIQLGEYVIGAYGSVRVIPLSVKGVPVRFVFPKEGTVRSSTTIAVVKGAANERLGQEFINELLAPKAQEILMNVQYFFPVNSKVAIPQKLIDLGLPTPEQLAKAIVLDHSAVAERRRDWARQIERELAP